MLLVVAAILSFIVSFIASFIALVIGPLGGGANIKSSLLCACTHGHTWPCLMYWVSAKEVSAHCTCLDSKNNVDVLSA